MRVLQARFHPRRQSDFLVVAHVVWDELRQQDHPTVQPAPALLLEAEPSAILSKLRYLLTVTAPQSFERLQTLPSRFWSFVEVPGVRRGLALEQASNKFPRRGGSG